MAMRRAGDEHPQRCTDCTVVSVRCRCVHSSQDSAQVATERWAVAADRRIRSHRRALSSYRGAAGAQVRRSYAGYCLRLRRHRRRLSAGRSGPADCSQPSTESVSSEPPCGRSSVVTTIRWQASDNRRVCRAFYPQKIFWVAEHAGGNASELRRRPEGLATSYMLHMKALFRPGSRGRRLSARAASVMEARLRST